MPFIVLGCGKGGTSLVAELMARMGIDMGTKLPLKSERKYRRHDGKYLNFEHREIRALNHRILAETGCDWWDAPTTDQLLEMEPIWRPMILKVIDGRREPWGWKCGLNAVMAPLYHQYLIDPRYVVIRRLNEAQHIESWVKHRYGRLKGEQYHKMRNYTIRGRRMIYDRIDDFLEKFNIPDSNKCEMTFEALTNKKDSYTMTVKLGRFINANPSSIKAAHSIIEYDGENKGEGGGRGRERVQATYTPDIVITGKIKTSPPIKPLTEPLSD